MITIGLDPHPDSYTVAALEDNGTTIASLTVSNDAEGMALLHRFALPFPKCRWAVEGAANRYILPFVSELLELLTRNTHEAITLLQRGEAAAAFVEGPLTGVPDEVERRVVGEDELVLITRPDHPLVGRQRVALGDLEGLLVVEREPGSGTREVVERALRQAGIKVSISLEATGIEAIKEAVLEGLGAGFISKLAVRREVAAGLLVSYPLGPSFSRPLTLLHPPIQLCSQATRMFLASLDITESSGNADGSPKFPQVT